MGDPDSVKMPGQVWGLAAPDPVGPVFATSYDGRHLNTTVLVAVDLAGAVRWRRAFDGPSRSAAGWRGRTVWIAHRGPAGHTITQVGTDGSVLRSVTPEQQPHDASARSSCRPT
jgi:hypothetical protein